MKNYSITKEQVKQLYQNNLDCKVQLVDADLKSWFPDAFKKELEVGKWYKLPDDKLLICITNIENRMAYGWSRAGEWYDSSDWGFSDLIIATNQEVESALIAEAKKRGYTTENTNCLWNYSDRTVDNEFYLMSNILFAAKSRLGGKVLFDKGKWATISETITKSEAEKLLNKKIV